MSDTQIVETPAVATETPSSPAPAVETPKETFDQTLERVAREVTTGGQRGPDGKFQPRVAAPSAPEVAEVPGSPTAAAPDPVPPVIDAPQSLPADRKDKWAALSPDWQEYLSKREGEVHQKFTTDGERLKAFTDLEGVLKPLDARLKQVGAPAHEYVRRLSAADQLLSTNGVQGALHLVQMYGIDRGALIAALQTGNQPGTQPTPNVPDVNALVSEQVQKALQGQRIAERQTEIGKFTAALPADEQPDFEKLESAMVGLSAAHPNWTLEQLYKAARRADPDTLAKDQAKDKAEADRKAAEEAKRKQEQDARLGPLSRKPGSTPAEPVKGKNWMETMDRVGKEVLARN